MPDIPSAVIAEWDESIGEYVDQWAAELEKEFRENDSADDSPPAAESISPMNAPGNVIGATSEPE